MAIPKIIHQTYKTAKLPLIFQWHIYNLKKRNPAYSYEFYDDARVDAFMRDNFDKEVYDLYSRINIGAAKADFFRYAVLYKKGGVYLDVDSRILTKIDDFVSPDDAAVISHEQGEACYIQYALFFEPNHPFLEKTIELLVENLQQNSFPYDTHKMTGPTVYTRGIEACMASLPDVSYKQLGINYENHVQFSFPGSKTFLYGFSRKNHWRKVGKATPVIGD